MLKYFCIWFRFWGDLCICKNPAVSLTPQSQTWFTQFFKFSLLFAVLRNFQHCFFSWLKLSWTLDKKRLIGFEDISQQFFSVKKKIMLSRWHRGVFYDTAVTELYCAMTYMTPCYQLVTMTPRGQKYRFEYLREIEAIFENLSENHSGAQMVLFSETNLGVTWQLTSK